MQDLQHPNEFIRGSTLRFLCKLKVGHIPTLSYNLSTNQDVIVVETLYSLFGNMFIKYNCG